MIKLFSKKKEKDNSDVFIENEYKFIYMNDMIDICTDACSVCWDKQIPNDLARRFKYISDRIKIGHESVIEHSNMVILLIVNKDNYEDIIKFLSCCDYVHAKTTFDSKRTYILVGGSVRGFKEIYRTIDNQKNTVLNILTRAIYQNCPSCFFEDFINDGIMKNMFIDFEENVFNGMPNNYHHIESANKDKIEIINFDSIDGKLMDSILALGFSPVDILDMMTCTILFKNMSRNGTHQLVRHRNAITQESQRYVDYSNASFCSPDEFKDKYSDNLYKIRLLDKEYTLKDLGSALISIYKDLREQGLDKEDARAYLPSNVECNKLYMTFTIKHLMMFLKLRCGKGAQAEIKEYANIIFNSINTNKGTLEDYVSYALMPSYKRDFVGASGDDLYASIDEVIE